MSFFCKHHKNFILPQVRKKKLVSSLVHTWVRTGYTYTCMYALDILGRNVHYYVCMGIRMGIRTGIRTDIRTGIRKGVRTGVQTIIHTPCTDIYTDLPSYRSDDVIMMTSFFDAKMVFERSCTTNFSLLTAFF